MSYEDTHPGGRSEDPPPALRARAQPRFGSRDDQVLQINEFLHPRVEEIADTLPAGWGRWLLRTGWARGLVSRFVSQGRVVQTSSIRGYCCSTVSPACAGCGGRPCDTQAERGRIEPWLAEIRRQRRLRLRLAVEIAACQRLVKGYSDTHARGLRNFQA